MSSADQEYLIKDQVNENISDASLLWNLLRMVVAFAPIEYGLGFLFLFAAGVCFAFGGYALSDLIERGFLARDQSMIWFYGAKVTGLLLLSLMLTWLFNAIFAQASFNAVHLVRMKLIEKLECLPMIYFDRVPKGRTIARLTNDVDSISVALSHSLPMLISSGCLAIAAFAGILSYSPLYALMILSIALLTCLPPIWTRKKLRALHRKDSKYNGKIYSLLNEFFNGILVVRNFNLRDFAGERLDLELGKQQATGLKRNFIFTITRTSVTLLDSLPTLVLLVYGGKLVFAGKLLIGDFAALLKFSDKLRDPFYQFSFLVMELQSAFASQERLIQFFAESEEDNLLGKNGELLLVGDSAVEIIYKQVAMSYLKDRPALRDVSFTLPAGKKLGLCGSTGGGKTSTAALLTRAYEFHSGEILLNGVDIRRYDRRSLRSAIGYVSQDVFVFEGTLFENLTLGRQTSEFFLNDLIKETGFSEVMARRGLNLGSKLADDGSNLSAGERQFISLLRVFVADPKIVILDEATANIDPEIEARFQSAAEKLFVGRTVLVIAHRLNTLRSCDLVLKIADGKIDWRGTSDEFFAKVDLKSVAEEAGLV
ncbi:MAG TPA: ABC transporter ATP-binding protein [Oligoflexia bacterium]|nr:ABC transporter ATP-binding protein [Oligoflexia bacterium]HMP26668.1 ABC transporter ATP-binding protein [Oligoflexia bacterium]